MAAIEILSPSNKDRPANRAAFIAKAATLLKNKIGTGGAIKDGQIEIQGDHRERVCTELEKLGYKTKRVGG